MACPNKPITFNNAADCKAIIGGGENKLKDLGLNNTIDRYESRARPNRRLVAAFGINNCFTTTDKGKCSRFRTDVEEKLFLDAATWGNYASSVTEIVKDEFKEPGETLNLFGLAQTVTMKAVMEPLFAPGTVALDCDDSIRQLAKEINEQWLRSKRDFDEGMWAFEKQTDLRQALETVFPSWDKTSETNPLNLILPGYETMWRVVLRCFLELTTRDHEQAGTWCKALQAFVKSPTMAQLDDEASGVAASWVPKEALRLYPPTRRVYREFIEADGKAYTVAADIEQTHRSDPIWGDGPLNFRPGRWQGVDKASEEDHLLAFSTRPFACPARRIKERTDPKTDEVSRCLPFGVSMIALLVGAMTAEVEGKWTVDGLLPAAGTPLDTERMAYNDVCLKRL